MKTIDNYMMLEFKAFFLEADKTDEEEDNVQAMIGKLPKGHQKLLKGYKFRYQKGNVLKGDDGHIGVIFKDKITVAAPWNYSREYTTLHEIGHLVWEYLITPKEKKEWNKLYNAEKEKQEGQDAEELWCMSYANHYAKHKCETHNFPAWDKFVKRVCLQHCGKSPKQSK
jgi:hypothetical protein